MLIILDCSESMGQWVSGKSKFQLAKEMVIQYLKTYPNHHYALLVYGSGVKQGCLDIDLAVPFKKGSISKILLALSKVKPYGTTPLSNALREGSQILEKFPKPREILLLTDDADSCGSPLKKITSLLNEKSIHLNAMLMFFSDTNKRKIATLKSLNRKKIIDYSHTISLQKLVYKLKPKRKIKRQNQFEPASLIENQDLKPKYPYFAKNYGLEGKVTIKMHINENGLVHKVDILKSSGHKILDRAAIITVRKWRFHPAKLNEKPTTDSQKKILVFSLLDADE